MKTLTDLRELMNAPCPPFDNQYSYLLEQLADYYLSKADSDSRIRSTLSDWNDEAKQIILNDLGEKIKLTGREFEFN